MRHKTRWILPIAVLAVIAMLIGCVPPNNNGSQPTTGIRTNQNNHNGNADAGLDDDSKFTILLYPHKSPTHVKEALQHKIDAEQNTGWEDIYVVHKDGCSELLVGHYKTKQEALRALKKVRAFTHNQNAIYRNAIVCPIPGKDVAPDTFDLRSAPADRKYSVLVAVFYDVPERNYLGHKKRAIEFCQEIRDGGQEAYYYLTHNRSCVALGSFPADAIKTIKVTKRHPRTRKKYKEDKNIIVSPKMQKILSDNPNMLVCGNNEINYVLTKDGRKKPVRQKTYPIKIPNR
ncbi:MAG: hypothetical protein KAR11_08320 [Phycisphaerae bacterium]|nr:hypothetical protein [Phycisphaerae bacterium]